MDAVKRIKEDWELHQLDGKENPHKDKPWGWQWGSDVIVEQVMVLVEEKIYGRVLEIGCGGGKWTKVLCDLADSVCAIDVHERAIVESATYEPRAEYKLSDGETIPYNKDEFDCVFTWDVFLHLPIPLVTQYLMESRRVGKSVIFALPDLTTKCGEEMFRDVVRAKKWRDMFSYGYMTYYAPQQIEEMMRVAGWGTRVKVGTVGVSRPRDTVYYGER